MNAVTLINNKPLSVKEFRGQRVVTFKDIDELHERLDGTVGRNFLNNKKRYIENVDYFLVKPSDIQNNEFYGSEISDSDIQKYEIRTSEINNRGTIFLTESGYLMSTKSLNDDLAWQVQRELINHYFRSKEMVDIQQLEDRLTKNILARLGQVPTPQTNDPIADAFFDVLRHALNNGYYLSRKMEKAPVSPSQKLLGAITQDFYYIISKEAHKLYADNAETPMSRNGLYAYLDKSGYLRKYHARDSTISKKIDGEYYRCLIFYRDKVKF